MGCSAMRARYYSRLVLLRALAIAMLIATSAGAPASAQTALPFVPALPGYEYAFPRDHGSHDEYKTEWWYYTGHFTANDGRRFGFELTFFRVGIVPPSAEVAKSRWELRNLSLAHFAITDVDGKAFRYYEKLNRASPFTAGGLRVRSVRSSASLPARATMRHAPSASVVARHPSLKTSR